MLFKGKAGIWLRYHQRSSETLFEGLGRNNVPIAREVLCLDGMQGYLLPHDANHDGVSD